MRDQGSEHSPISHYHYLLCKGIYNQINLNDDNLSVKGSQTTSFTPHFLPILQICHLVSSINTKMGTRKIINSFIDAVIYVARIVFNEERFVIHHDWETELAEALGIGIVSGPLDYAAQRANGEWIHN